TLGNDRVLAVAVGVATSVPVAAVPVAVGVVPGVVGVTVVTARVVVVVAAVLVVVVPVVAVPVLVVPVAVVPGVLVPVVLIVGLLPALGIRLVMSGAGERCTRRECHRGDSRTDDDELGDEIHANFFLSLSVLPC